MNPQSVLETPRLLLRAATPEFADAWAKFHQRNRSHLAPWSPPMREEIFTEEGQSQLLQGAEEAFSNGTAWKWILFAREDEGTAIGHVHLSQVFRGVFQSSMLGYALDASHEGSGLMSESLVTVIGEAFSDRGRLHRIQANVMPHNLRSLSLLNRLGFQREGLASKYLFIDGAWQDHVLTALINPKFNPRWI